MLTLILDGECHNGHHAGRLGPRHWRFEARGDDGHYCYYFHCTVHAEAAGEAIIDIGPDRELLPESAESFRLHRPETVWLSRGHGWERHAVTPDAPPEVVRVRVELTAGESVLISRMWPCAYSGVVKRVQEMDSHPEARSYALGRTAEGREIAAMEVGTGENPVLVLAGQHPAEFGGTEAVMGVAEWLLSRLPEAREVRRHYTVTLVPVLNPDGNIAGRCGRNARGEDLYRAFEGAATGVTPAAPEAACLWDWVRSRQPVLSLNFHTYTQPSPGGSLPWEGLYTVPDEAFTDEVARERQRLLDDRLAWETDGLSQSGGFAHHAPGALEYQLATMGVRTVFYEVQDSVGPQRHRRTGVHVLRTALRGLNAQESQMK